MALWLWLVLGAACASTPDRAGDGDGAGFEPPPQVDVQAQATVVDDQTAADEGVQAFLDPYRQQVEARSQRVVGTLAGPLTRNRDGESSMGNFVTDAMRSGVFEMAGVKADVCFTNMGGLRIDLDPGSVTAGQVVELMPFDNGIVLFTVDGARLEKIVRRLAERGDPASGLRYARAEAGPTEIVVGDAPLDHKKRYAVCTNDYLFEGGGDYKLGDIEGPVYTGVLLRDVIEAAFLRAQAAGQPIDPVLDGRAGGPGAS